MSHLSKPHSSSVVTERSPKKGFSISAISFHQRECIVFTRYHFKETLMHFNMAHQVDQIKPISNLKEKLMRSEVVFHEILLLQGTAASRQLLKVQNSVLPLITFPFPLTSTHRNDYQEFRKKLKLVFQKSI